MIDSCKNMSQNQIQYQAQNLGFSINNIFISIHNDFKFRIIQTFHSKRRTCIFTGFLVFNNGQTVYINPTHHLFIYNVLNNKVKKKINKVIYSIDPNRQTLSFSSKNGNVDTYNQLQLCRKNIETQLLQKKKTILSLICLLLQPLSSENSFINKLLIQKRKLKKQLELILSKAQIDLKNYYDQQRLNKKVHNSRQLQHGIIYFGQNTSYKLQKPQQKICQQQAEILANGGYFKIQNSPFKIISTRNNNIIGNNLVLKSLNQKRKCQNKVKETLKKLQRELDIISLIEDKKYLINYYIQKKQQETFQEIYMDKYQYSLYDYMDYTDQSLDIHHKIIIAQQILQSAILLHNSYVIHRDIKPSNFLITDNIADNRINIKIIDFAQSFSPKMTIKQGSFGCSHPYSPFQCTQKRKIINGQGQQGLSKQQIDNWSIGVTIYELFFKKLPISYSKIHLIDILCCWRTQLLSLMEQRQKIGINLIQNIIQITCVKLMRIKQNERLSLYKALQIMKILQQYLQKLYKMFTN